MNRPDRSILAIIAINVLVFLLWNRGPTEFMAQHFLVSPEAVLSGRFWTLITSAFSQMDATHLLFNLITFYFFGRAILGRTGEKGLLVLYLGGALLASLAHVAFALLVGEDIAALGASGSVMAIAVMFACLYPRRTVLIGFFFPMPAAMAVGLFILFDLIGSFGTVSRGTWGSVAHAAHLGGAVFGFLYWWFWMRPRRDQAAGAFEEYYERQRRP